MTVFVRDTGRDGPQDSPGILIVGNYPPPYGGVPKHIEDLAAGLVQRGWRVHVLSGGRGGIERRGGVTVHRDARSWPRRRGDLVRFLWDTQQNGRGGPLWTYRRRAPLIRWLGYVGRAAIAARIIEREAIDVVSGYNLLSGAPVACLVGEMYGLPAVVSNFGEIYSTPDRARRERELIRRMTERSAGLICMTQHCANSYSMLGLHPEVRIVPYGMDLERFAPGDGIPIRHALGFGSEDRVALFVGRMITDMGVDTMLQVIRLVAPVDARARFIIAGARGDLTGEATRLAAEMQDRVRILVDVPAEDLAGLYRAADVIVVPTKGARACGSLAAGEAAASAKAVVGARVGGVPEYVVENETGVLVPPDDPIGFADAVVALFADDDRRERMGRAGLAFVRSRYDVSATNHAMHELLMEVIAHRPSAVPASSN